VCYKPCMRKWMRERLQRRKKNQEQKAPAESAPAPLQPAFYDAAEPAATEAEPQSDPESPPSLEEVSAPEAPAPPQSGHAEPNEGRPKRRRRRGRGGRGGRGAAPSTPQAQPLQPTLIRPSETPEAAASEPAALNVQATTPATARVPKGVVVLAIGLPASGKSSWFKRHGIAPLSSDLLRQLLFDDANEQRFQDLVISNLRSMLKARLIARRPMNYVDATNLSQHDRHTWIKMAHDYGYEVHAVFFDVPLEVCLERNQKRQRTVAEDVMRRMASKLRPPTFEEGFAKITVVRVKKKETA
jgi:predicted kinase